MGTMEEVLHSLSSGARSVGRSSADGKRSSADSRGKISPSCTKLKKRDPAEVPFERRLVVAPGAVVVEYVPSILEIPPLIVCKDITPGTTSSREQFEAAKFLHGEEFVDAQIQAWILLLQTLDDGWYVNVLPFFEFVQAFMPAFGVVWLEIGFAGIACRQCFCNVAIPVNAPEATAEVLCSLDYAMGVCSPEVGLIVGNGCGTKIWIASSEGDTCLEATKGTSIWSCRNQLSNLGLVVLTHEESPVVKERQIAFEVKVHCSKAVVESDHVCNLVRAEEERMAWYGDLRAAVPCVGYQLLPYALVLYAVYFWNPWSIASKVIENVPIFPKYIAAATTAREKGNNMIFKPAKASKLLLETAPSSVYGGRTNPLATKKRCTHELPIIVASSVRYKDRSWRTSCLCLYRRSTRFVDRIHMEKRARTPTLMAEQKHTRKATKGSYLSLIDRSESQHMPHTVHLMSSIKKKENKKMDIEMSSCKVMSTQSPFELHLSFPGPDRHFYAPTIVHAKMVPKSSSTCGRGLRGLVRSPFSSTAGFRCLVYSQLRPIFSSLSAISSSAFCFHRSNRHQSHCRVQARREHAPRANGPSEPRQSRRVP
ncbi:phosphoglycerate mutase-like protein, partial [Aureobasidium melanogenum]